VVSEHAEKDVAVEAIKELETQIQAIREASS